MRPRKEPWSGSQSAACPRPHDYPRLWPIYKAGKPAKQTGSAAGITRVGISSQGLRPRSRVGISMRGSVMSYLLVWHQKSNWCHQKTAVLHHYGNSCLVVLGARMHAVTLFWGIPWCHRWENPHTSSSHMTTKIIKVHSNYVLATSNLFDTRENAPLPLHT